MPGSDAKRSVGTRAALANFWSYAEFFPGCICFIRVLLCRSVRLKQPEIAEEEEEVVEDDDDEQQGLCVCVCVCVGGLRFRVQVCVCAGACYCYILPIYFKGVL